MKILRAVIEDNNDPEKLGRVKVRIFGLHTENNENSSEEFNYVSTSNLPWAEIMGGTTFGLISGIGISNILRQGTWVWVVLHDDNPNKPIVIGTIIGITGDSPVNQYSSGKGFCDPDGVYPKENRLHRSDINPLLDSKYLTLSVLETPSGHVIEIDDTIGEESITVKHKDQNSYIKIDQSGKVWIHSSGDMALNAGGNMTLNAGGNCTVTATRIDLNP